MSENRPVWLDFARRIQAIAQSGLAYTKNQYDIERYEELRDLAVRMAALYTDTDVEKVRELFAAETGYQTPKVDVRAVVFRDDRILLVREKIDGRWSLPGGWADIGYSPAEVAVKEVQEEAGLDVKPVRLLAVLDKKFFAHPPEPWYVYKIFFLCEDEGGAVSPGMETSGAQFFAVSELPPLSLNRNTPEQIALMFEFLHSPEKPVVFN